MTAVATGDWRTLHSEELHDFYLSPTNIKLIKSRKMRLERHVTNIAEKKRKDKVFSRET
jgi:hypothetical protein